MKSLEISDEAYNLLQQDCLDTGLSVSDLLIQYFKRVKTSDNQDRIELLQINNARDNKDMDKALDLLAKSSWSGMKS